MHKLEVKRTTRFFPALIHRDEPNLRVEYTPQVISAIERLKMWERLIDYHPWIATPFLAEARKIGLSEAEIGWLPFELPSMGEGITSALLLQLFGLVMSNEMSSGEHSGAVTESWQNKYKSFDELVGWLNQQRQIKQLTIGLVTGSFDPPHVGHARAIATIWPYCDFVLVGVDSNDLTSCRKGDLDDERPRFPALAWRLRELASLPFVDYVFVNPITYWDDLDRQFETLYQQLGVTILGSGRDNALLMEYQRRMRMTGGHVIVQHDASYSSTLLMRLARTKLRQLHYPFLTWEKKIAELNQEALNAGYLRT